jgi:phosphatidylglycerophosphate synthase
MADKSLPPSIAWEQRSYQRLLQWRTTALRPVARLLTYFRVTPGLVSLFGVLLMFGFLVTAASRPQLALVLAFLSIASDWLDGSLARYQRVGSDRGKFLDMICDMTTFALFMIGLINAELLGGQFALLLVFAVTLDKWLRIIWQNRYLTTTWHLKAVAGFLPAFVGGVHYVAFIPWVLWEANYYLLVSPILLVVVLGDIVATYRKIVTPARS